MKILPPRSIPPFAHSRPPQLQPPSKHLFISYGLSQSVSVPIKTNKVILILPLMVASPHTVLSTVYQFILKITGHSGLTHSFLELRCYSSVWICHNLLNQSLPGGQFELFMTFPADLFEPAPQLTLLGPPSYSLLPSPTVLSPCRGLHTCHTPSQGPVAQAGCCSSEPLTPC